MRFQRAIFCLVAVLWATSQAHAQILVDAGMTVQEGGTARASGMVLADHTGAFEVAFSAGDLRSLRMPRFSSVFIPGLTASFEGPATATIVRNGQSQTVRGTCFVYVDDLAFVSAPDQMFLLFTGPAGIGTMVRHGTVFRGDILVITP